MIDEDLILSEMKKEGFKMSYAGSEQYPLTSWRVNGTQRILRSYKGLPSQMFEGNGFHRIYVWQNEDGMTHNICGPAEVWVHMYTGEQRHYFYIDGNVSLGFAEWFEENLYNKNNEIDEADIVLAEMKWRK